MATLDLSARTRAPTLSKREQSSLAHAMNVRRLLSAGGPAVMTAGEGAISGERGGGAGGNPHDRRASPSAKNGGKPPALPSSPPSLATAGRGARRPIGSPP